LETSLVELDALVPPSDVPAFEGVGFADAVPSPEVEVDFRESVR
jgi:hypothetical protein